VVLYENHLVRAKIVTHGHILEQVSSFQYLRCEISCAYGKYVENKLHCYQAIGETIQRAMRGEIQTQTQFKFYKVKATLALFYGSEAWLRRKKEENRIYATDIRFLKAAKECTRED
jgi:hypothetical protein